MILFRKLKKITKHTINGNNSEHDDVEKRRYLAAKFDLPPDEIALTKAKAEAVFRATDIMDMRSEDNCAEMERATGILTAIAMLPMGIISVIISKNIVKEAKTDGIRKVAMTNGIILFLSLSASAALAIMAAAAQKEASRIGRFQAKQKELKNPNNFIIYTDTQKKEALEKAKSLPDKADIKKNLKESLAVLKQLKKDRPEYNKAIKQKEEQQKKIDKILKKSFSEEQLKKGEYDKEIIVNIVKDVNMNAEKYTENMENMFDAIGSLSLFVNIPIYFVLNKVLHKFKGLPKTTKNIMPLVTSFVLTIPMINWATKEKREAARVGRYQARKEILNNPELIMMYTPEQLEQAKNIKAPKINTSFLNKIKKNIEFFKTYFVDAKEYKAYKKTNKASDEKYYEALKQVKVTDAQISDAKKLQERTFMVFDKIDEMSQRYSEDTEAATQVVAQCLAPIFTTIGTVVPLVSILKIKDGKFPLRGITKNISKLLFDKNSEVRRFVMNAFAVIDNDPALKKAYSKILIDKGAQLKLANHPQIAELLKEFSKQNKNVILQFNQAVKNNDTKEMREIIKAFLKKNARKDKVSQWLMNLINDIVSLRGKLKEDKINGQVNVVNDNKSLIEKIKGFYKEYKTLINTVLAGGFIPMLGFTVGIPVLISSWFTNLQIKAGNIGIMKAMQEVDNPKLFIDIDEQTL